MHTASGVGRRGRGALAERRQIWQLLSTGFDKRHGRAAGAGEVVLDLVRADQDNRRFVDAVSAGVTVPDLDPTEIGKMIVCVPESLTRNLADEISRLRQPWLFACDMRHNRHLAPAQVIAANPKTVIYFVRIGIGVTDLA